MVVVLYSPVFASFTCFVGSFSQRRHVRQVRRCDDSERLLRYFEEEMKKHNVVAQVRPKLVVFVIACLAQVSGATFLPEYSPAVCSTLLL